MTQFQIEILAQAQRIAEDPQQGPDSAARFLAPYRQKACESIHDDISKIADLLLIASDQANYLNQAGFYDKSVGIAEWFLHTLHHIEEEMPAMEFRRLKQAFRETFSRFFYRYARGLRECRRYKDMRIAMRTSIDLTQELPGVILMAVHLYQPLLNITDKIENESSRAWFLSRCAEFLAVLDFSGLHQSPFRQCLDEYQYMIRNPSEANESLNRISRIAAQEHDPVMDTLKTMAEMISR